MTHDEATRHAVALFGPRATAVVTAVCTLAADGTVHVARDFRIGYRPASASSSTAAVLVARGATWAAALTQARAFVQEREQKGHTRNGPDRP